MGKKYKIGDVSRLLGIPTQTLHYYEECGFVHPTRDPESNYRYYDAWDINFLIDTKLYRSFNFNNEEISHIINDYSFEQYQYIFKDKEKELIADILHKQKLLDKLIIYNNKISEMKTKIDTYSVVSSPQIYFIPYRKKLKYEYINGDDSVITDQGLNVLVGELPLVETSFMIENKDLSKIENCDDINFWWGFSASPEKVGSLDISNDHKLYKQPTKSLYTIFTSTDETNISIDFYENIYKKVVEEMGYKIKGNPFGNLLAKVHEDDQLIRYNEVWIPIK